MLQFENLTKSFFVNGSRKMVFENLNLVVPEKKSLALLGRNGAGKSTLMRIISGTMNADSGRVIRRGRISWTVGLGRTAHPDMTGAQNVTFVARVYGVDTEELQRFVYDFSELGSHFYMPVRTYSSGMKARLAFGTVMGIQFDTYLIDEVMAVGDAGFRRKSKAVFRERIDNAGALVVSHNMNELASLCDAALVLDSGSVSYYDDLNEAIKIHEARFA